MSDLQHTVVRLRELMGKASPAPWCAANGFIIPKNGATRFDAVCSVVNCDGDTIANRDLIVAAINALPEILAAISPEPT